MKILSSFRSLFLRIVAVTFFLAVTTGYCAGVPDEGVWLPLDDLGFANVPVN